MSGAAMPRKRLAGLAFALFAGAVLFVTLRPDTPGVRNVLQSGGSDIISGVTGRLFRGDVIRRFGSAMFGGDATQAVPAANPSGFVAQKWAVCTTIHPPSDAILGFGKLQDWALVVVGDEGTPAFPDLGSRAVMLDAAAQRRMAHDFAGLFELLPWRHFGRKNVGYLYAILHGAEEVWDFDDDNVLKAGVQPTAPSADAVAPKVGADCAAFNPYPHMGAPASDVEAWPRGFPLNLIRAPCAHTLEAVAAAGDVAVWQSLANNEPDVDGIFRLTRLTPFSFDANSETSVIIPQRVFCPYNAQATLVLQPALWSLLLPVTVHGRVSDIWRSYIAQRVLWDAGKRIAFTPPRVTQFRNPHNPLADMQAEGDLYLKSLALVERLREWRGSAPTIAGRYEELTIDLYERGYLQVGDVHLTQQWIAALHQVGYRFPPVHAQAAALS